MPRWSKLVAIAAVVGSVVYVGTQVHRHHRRWEHIHDQVDALMEQRYQTQYTPGNAAVDYGVHPKPCKKQFSPDEEEEHRDGGWFGFHHHRHRHHEEHDEVSPRSPSHSDDGSRYDPRRDPRGFNVDEPRVVIDPPEVFYTETNQPGYEPGVQTVDDPQPETSSIISDPADFFNHDGSDIEIRIPDLDISFPPDIALPDERIRFPTDIRFPEVIQDRLLEQHVDGFNPQDLHQREVAPEVYSTEFQVPAVEIAPAEADERVQWRRIHHEIRRLKRDGCRQTGAFVAGAAFAGGVAHLVALRRERRRREEEERAQSQAQPEQPQPRGTADI